MDPFLNFYAPVLSIKDEDRICALEQTVCLAIDDLVVDDGGTTDNIDTDASTMSFVPECLIAPSFERWITVIARLRNYDFRTLAHQLRASLP